MKRIFERALLSFMLLRLERAMGEGFDSALSLRIDGLLHRLEELS